MLLKIRSSLVLMAGIAVFTLAPLCGLTQVAPTDQNDLPAALEIAKNQLGPNTVVYTYNFDNVNFGNEGQQADNAIQPAIVNPQVNTALNTLLSITGVTRATFDRATKTITVVATAEAVLPELIKL